jgi:zinc-ribbon family
MFFIFGIDTVTKPLEYEKLIICGQCGRYGRYKIYMTYMCFSLFFIPIIKWNRHYYVETTCCNSLYELNPEVGKRIKNRENIEIAEKDLTLIRKSNNGYSHSNSEYGKQCIYCGYVSSEDFQYCPKCGHKL